MLPINKLSYNSIPPPENFSSWKKEITDSFFISSQLEIKWEYKLFSDILLVVGLDENTTLIVERKLSTLHFIASNHFTLEKIVLGKLKIPIFCKASVIYNERVKKLIISIGNTVYLYNVRVGRVKSVNKLRVIELEDNIRDIFVYTGDTLGFWYLSDKNKIGFVELKKFDGESPSKKPWRATICLRQLTSYVPSNEIIAATFSHKKNLFVVTNESFYLLRSTPTGIEGIKIPGLPAKIDQSQEEAVMKKIRKTSDVISNFVMHNNKSCLLYLCNEGGKTRLKKYSIKDGGVASSVELKQKFVEPVIIYNPNPGVLYLSTKEHLFIVKDKTRIKV